MKLRPVKPLRERIEDKVDRDPNPLGCWFWLGTLNRTGYGVVGRGRRGEGNVLVHRAMYEFYIEPVAADLDLDHLCREPECVNPWHLEPVTRSENARRQHIAYAWQRLLDGAA